MMMTGIGTSQQRALGGEYRRKRECHRPAYQAVLAHRQVEELLEERRLWKQQIRQDLLVDANYFLIRRRRRVVVRDLPAILRDDE